MRVLTDPVETGAVTLALPQDVQAEAYDWPEELFAERELARRTAVARGIASSTRRPDCSATSRASVDRGRRRRGLLRGERRAADVRRGDRHPGRRNPRQARDRCATTTRSRSARSARPGRRRRTRWPATADLVIGIGTRYADFTTASRTAFQNPDVRFVNINVARFDGGKHAGLPVVADAREALDCAGDRARRLVGRRRVHGPRPRELASEWDAIVEQAYNPPAEVTGKLADGLLTQGEVLGAVNELSEPRDVVVCAAGSMPGDLHKLWRTRDPQGLPRRVRLLLHGLRDRRRDRRPTRRPGPGRVRHGRRRLLPDDVDRAGHRGRRRTSR